MITAGAATRVSVFGAALAGEGATRAMLDGLVRAAGARPAEVLLRHAPHRATKDLLAGYDLGGGPRPPHDHIKSGFFRGSLPGEAVRRLVDDLAERSPGEARELDFSPWSGAYDRVPEDATAFPHRNERFLLKLTAAVAEGREPSGWLARAWETVRPYWSGGVYPNFPEPGIRAVSGEYHGANRHRLEEIRRRRPGWP
ncbi:hypothetical protein [Actinomadura sp. 21ATH]|uniref:hypothetical protein n=1 Tax=Actinomadura sp. 21ATH TaxID=1735444 RepID=UPI0035C1F35B